MKRDQLKPFVFKVEGAKRVTLYNILNGCLYHFSHEGNVEEVRKELLKEGLIFETTGVVPEKIVRLDLMEYKNRLFLRELQIRLNGRRENNCWERKKNDLETVFMSHSVLNRLIETSDNIPIEKIRIECEVYEADKVEAILKELPCSSIELFVESGITCKQFQTLTEKYHKVNLQLINDPQKKIKEHRIDIFPFLYSQYFNPCLGHQAAVDANGDIKSCLWFEEALGNIEQDNIKEMIIGGAFDIYWNAIKTKIDGCKDCEFRRVCTDCRADVMNKGKKINSKPTFCEYDPY